MTTQGLIDHSYAAAFEKIACTYYMATYYYIYQMYVGKNDIEQASEIFFPKKISQAVFRNLPSKDKNVSFSSIIFTLVQKFKIV